MTTVRQTQTQSQGGRNNRKARRRGPESRSYDDLKGQRVRIVWLKPGKPDTTATLVWVDHYTVGIDYGGDDGVRITYKHAILDLGAAA